ncbi:MAG: DNA alkylation repair protein [Promethearchaeota archaeon]
MMQQITDKIHKELQESSNPYRKEKIAEYLKTSTLNFIGVELPEIHRIVKAHIKSLNLQQLPELMKYLWEIETFETRLAAIDVMKVYAKKGPVSDAIGIADDWIGEADTWGLVDPLCSPCIGSLIIRSPEAEETIRSWGGSKNVWRRRASVLPFLHLALKTQYRPEYRDKILEAVTPHISDEEFFVGKAAGWVLRELSKREPEALRSYFEKNREMMTALVYREGSRKL